MLRVLLLLFSAAVLGVASPAAADQQMGGRRVALVIGNSSYRDVERLPNAANDARLIAATLQARGFTLVGGGPQLDLSRAHLATAVQAFGLALRGADVGLFYYAGHGMQVRGMNWLLPTDAKPERPQDLGQQAVDVAQVLHQMGAAGTRVNLVLLDTCREDPFAPIGLDAAPLVQSEMHVPANILISYATQPNDVAVDSDDDGDRANGPYARALAMVLRQPEVELAAAVDRVGVMEQHRMGETRYASSKTPIPGGNTTPTRQIVAAPTAAGCLPWIAGTARDCDRPTRHLITRGIRMVRPESEVLQAFASEPVDALGALIRNTREAADGPFVQLSRRTITAGEPLALSLQGAAGEAIAIDVFRPGNTVQHVPLQAALTEGGDVRVSIAPADMPRSGGGLLVAVLSPARLALGTRPRTERASAYRAALQQALLQSGGQLRADMALFDVQAAPVPTPLPAAAPQAVRPPARPPRCKGILERAQLGEDISDSDRAFLRTACR
jgi:Caspase domain